MHNQDGFKSEKFRKQKRGMEQVFSSLPKPSQSPQTSQTPQTPQTGQFGLKSQTGQTGVTAFAGPFPLVAHCRAILSPFNSRASGGIETKYLRLVRFLRGLRLVRLVRYE